MPYPGLSYGLDLFKVNPDTIAIIKAPGFDVYPPGTGLVEDPDSPTFTLGEQGQIVKKFTGDWWTCLANQVPRGTYVTDTSGNTWRSLNWQVTRERSGMGKITWTCESISFAAPPDDWNIESVELNPALEKNAKFAGLSDQDIQHIRKAIELPGELAATEAANQNPYAVDTTNYNLFNSLLSKLRRGEDTYYQAGFRVTWVQYSFLPQPKLMGGFIQDPTDVAPSDFWDNGSENTIPDGLSWLRLCDTEHFQRTWFALTRTWLGGPGGMWDTDIYTT